MVDLGSKGREFESHWRHCVVSLTLYPLLSAGLTQEDRKLSRHDSLKNCFPDIKYQHKQNRPNKVFKGF